MRAYNKRLNHKTDVAYINYEDNKIGLIQPGSNPKFIYDEKLDNVVLLEFTGVELQGHKVYVDDIVTDGSKKYKVIKVPGGYLPFILPVNKEFKYEM